MWEFIEIGKVLKPYRRSGELLAIIRPEIFEDFENCKAVFLKVDGLKVPFFLESFELDKESCVLKLEEINSPEEVKKYNGKTLFLRTSDVKEKFHKSNYKDPLELFAGFSISVEQLNLNLKIEKVEQYPQQLMALVIYKGKNVLIPLVEAYIENIDQEHKKIFMNLPDGIL